MIIGKHRAYGQCGARSRVLGCRLSSRSPGRRPLGCATRLGLSI